jgi:4-hydroxybutyryl-CoA dehydratase / vinylacetyl-CoA-Delta-isomerase
MKTAAEYIQSLRERHIELWIDGELVDNPVDHPAVRPSIESVAMTYALAEDPETRDLAVAHSDLIDGPVNRFTHLFADAADLTAKLTLQRHLGRETGTCFQRCVGMDALNALYIATWESSPEAHGRFTTWLRGVQQRDEMLCGAMTDAKGHRKTRASGQPEAFVRVVERREDGVVLRGAKLHQTGGANAHQILVMPGGVYKEGEEAFAIAAAIPVDAPGVTMLLGKQPSDARKGGADAGNQRFGGQEVVVWLEDVFVPHENVFLDGDIQAAATMLQAFAGFHRASYGGCKPGNFDVLIGASAALVEDAGIRRNSAVRDKLIEMTHLTESIHGIGLAASGKSARHGSGVWQVDRVLANVCKQTVTRLPYEIARIAEDLAGGLIATLPGLDSWENPRLAPIMDNIAGSKSRAKLLRLVEYMTYGAGSVPLRIECMHGAGSPQAQRIVIERETDWEAKMAAARRLAGIDAQTDATDRTTRDSAQAAR